MSSSEWTIPLREAQARLPEDPATMRFHYGLRHGTMKVGLSAPCEWDAQGPHRQDELYIVISGTGDFVKGTERRGSAPRDVLFVEAGIEHRFENFSAAFATWVIFWGAQGGEA